MNESLVYEWTRGQWAEAAAWFGNAYGWMPLPTAAGALRIYYGWLARRDDAPGAHTVVVNEYRGARRPQIELNRKWAHLMFAAVIRERGMIPVAFI